MPVYAALLQGVNIGSKKRINMEDLRALIADAGGTDARTYINSGNIVFRHDAEDACELEQRLEASIGKHVGMPIPTIVRTADELEEVIATNPFPEAIEEPKTLHVLFLRHEPGIDNVNAATEIETGSDRLAILGREVFFFLPNFTTGASVDMKQVQKVLDIDAATARNWNTVTKLAGMTRELDPP